MGHRCNATGSLQRARDAGAGSVALVIRLSSLSRRVVGCRAGEQRTIRGNRYEGRIDVPVSGSSLELLSFVGRVERYSGAVDLNVRFYLPTDEELTCGVTPPETSGVKVEARELREDKLYYMESKGDLGWDLGAWNRFGPWETGTVLDREGIQPSNLGVLVKLEKKPWTAVAPAFVYQTQPNRCRSSPTGSISDRTLPSARRATSCLGCQDGEPVELAAATLRGDKIAGEPFAHSSGRE